MNENSLKLIAREFSHLKGLYFNSAYFGPSPGRARTYVEKALQRELDPSFFPYDIWINYPDVIRSKVAKFLGCSPDSIALATSVTQIINTVANGLTLSPNDQVVLIKGDYPSTILPWMVGQENYGYQVHLLDSELPTAQWLAQALPKQTKVFCISHVAFNTGRKIDLLSIGKLMRERGIFFIVDCTQSLGGLEISSEELSNIDVLACATYKWMLGPYGQGFGYFSSKAQELVNHKFGNWITSPNSKDSNHLLEYTTRTTPGARKYDRGQAPNMLTNACFEASLDLYLELDMKQVTQYNQDLRDYFLQLYPRKRYQLITPQEGMGNILCLKSTKDPLDLKRELEKANVDISVREGNMRLSFHFFNTKTQVESLVKALDF